MLKKRVVVSGASGFVGRNIGSFLSANGFEVIALVRKKKASFGRSVKTEDLTEKNICRHARGAAALLHFIGTGRQTVRSDFESVNVGLTANAVELCKNSGIRKIIYFSGLGVERDSTTGYFISKFKAEQEIVRSGLDYTIFRPSYIMGKDDPLSRTLSAQARKGRVVIPGSGRYRMQPIFVYDAAKMVMRAIYGRKFSRKVLDLVGPETVTFNRLVGDLVGRSRVRHVDFEEAYHEAISLKDSPYGVDDLGILVGDYLGDHRKLARISGVAFTRYADMLESCRLS